MQRMPLTGRPKCATKLPIRYDFEDKTLYLSTSDNSCDNMVAYALTVGLSTFLEFVEG